MTALDRLIAATGDLDIALHTVEVVRGDETLVSTACAPLTVHTPHRMYSVSKSVTGLAVGIAAAEGLLDLDDPLLAHYPEMAPVHPRIAATTVRDLLAMRGPHRATTFKRYDGGWVESWFRIPPTHRSGTVFTYDTSGSHLLAALVERLAGTSLTTYLRPRLLDPLGVSDDFRFLTDPQGVSQGGSGLVCTPRDLLLLSRLVHAGGAGADPTGAPALPADFLPAATTVQADTSMLSWGAQLRGYGYQLWLPRRGGSAMFGMGGQIVYSDPAEDLRIVVTADTQGCPAGDQRLVDLVVGELADEWAGAPGPAVEQPAPRWPSPPHDPSYARPVSGSWAGQGRSVELDLDADGGTLRLADDGAAPCTLDLRPGEPQATRVTAVVGPDPAPAVVTAGWTAPSSLDVRCHVLGDELATLRLRVVLHDDGAMTLRSQAFGESVAARWTDVGTYLPVSP